MIDINKLSNIVKAVSLNEIVPRFNQCITYDKQDGSLVTEADFAVQEQIQQQLEQHWPEYGFYSEEQDKTKMSGFFEQYKKGYWCLDPLDGTSNFSTGLPYFAVSLALIIEQETIAGIVYDPLRGECFTAVKGQGACLNEKLIVNNSIPVELDQCIANVDLKRLPLELRIKLVSIPPYRSQRSFGAAALDWCWLATNRCQLFLHGKQMLWDYAAGLLIAEEAGCASISLQGKTIFSENLKPQQIVAAVDKHLLNQWFNFIKP